MQKNNYNISYSCPLAKIIEAFVKEKQAIGYKYLKQVKTFKRFDKFCIMVKHNKMSLTKKLVLMWAENGMNSKN